MAEPMTPGDAVTCYELGRQAGYWNGFRDGARATYEYEVGRAVANSERGVRDSCAPRGTRHRPVRGGAA